MWHTPLWGKVGVTMSAGIEAWEWGLAYGVLILLNVTRDGRALGARGAFCARPGEAGLRGG